METDSTLILDAQRNPMPVVAYASAATATATTSQQHAAIDTEKQKIVTFFALDDRIWIKVANTETVTAVAEGDDCIPVEAGTSRDMVIPAAHKWAVIGGKYTYAVAR